MADEPRELKQVPTAKWDNVKKQLVLSKKEDPPPARPGFESKAAQGGWIDPYWYGGTPPRFKPNPATGQNEIRADRDPNKPSGDKVVGAKSGTKNYVQPDLSEEATRERDALREWQDKLPRASTSVSSAGYDLTLPGNAGREGLARVMGAEGAREFYKNVQAPFKDVPVVTEDQARAQSLAQELQDKLKPPPEDPNAPVAYAMGVPLGPDGKPIQQKPAAGAPVPGAGQAGGGYGYGGGGGGGGGGGSAAYAVRAGGGAGGDPFDAALEPLDKQIEKFRAQGMTAQQAYQAAAKSHENAALALQAQNDSFQKAEAARLKTQERYQMALNKASNDLSKAAKIDPDRWWNSRSPLQQIATMLSVAGAAFFSRDGNNFALENVNKMIDRDIESQKADFLTKRQALDSKQTAFAMAMQRTGDARAAERLARASMLETVAEYAKSKQATLEGMKDALNMEKFITDIHQQREHNLITAGWHLMTSKYGRGYVNAAGAISAGGGGAGGAGQGGGGAGGWGGPAGPGGNGGGGGGTGGPELGGVANPELVVKVATVVGPDGKPRDIGISVGHKQDQERIAKKLEAMTEVDMAMKRLNQLHKQIEANPRMLLDANVRSTVDREVNSNLQRITTAIGGGVMQAQETGPAQAIIGSSRGLLGALRIGAGALVPGLFAKMSAQSDAAINAWQGVQRNMIAGTPGTVVMLDGTMNVREGKSGPTYEHARWRTVNGVSPGSMFGNGPMGGGAPAYPSSGQPVAPPPRRK